MHAKRPIIGGAILASAKSLDILADPQRSTECMEIYVTFEWPSGFTRHLIHLEDLEDLIREMIKIQECMFKNINIET